MAYRDETDPLKTKEAALANELASLQRREREVASELSAARAALRKDRKLPLLDDVKVASPCTARWEDMIGDERVRFCGKCAKNVFNLSEMVREEAEALLAASEGKDLCIRLYQRADGTVLSADCPVGASRKRVKNVAAVATATAMAMVGAGAAAALMPGPQPSLDAHADWVSPPAASGEPSPATSAGEYHHVTLGKRAITRPPSSHKHDEVPKPHTLRTLDPLNETLE